MSDPESTSAVAGIDQQVLAEHRRIPEFTRQEVLRGAPTLARRRRQHEAAADEILFETRCGDLGQGD